MKKRQSKKNLTKPQSSRSTSRSTRKGYTPFKLPRTEESVITYKTPQELRGILRTATSKSKYRHQAAQDIDKLYTRLANITNKRLRALEKAGYAYYAYDRLQGYLSAAYIGKRKRVPTRLLQSTHEKYDTLLELITFLQSESSTPAGQVNIRQRRLASFREHGLNISDDDAPKFLDWLGSATWNGITKLIGSDVIIDDINALFQEGNHISQIIEAFERVLAGESEYEDELENMGVIL